MRCPYIAKRNVAVARVSSRAGSASPPTYPQINCVAAPAAPDVGPEADAAGRRPAPHLVNITTRHRFASNMSNSAFCACNRFSAWSNTADAADSITASVTSSPRDAGRQCMKIVSSRAFAINASFT